MNPKAKKVVIDATYWREHFINWVGTVYKSSFESIHPLGADRDWLDLTINPIVHIRPAYPDSTRVREYEEGAEITLRDGTRYRFDRLHGGGFWDMKWGGWFFEVPHTHRMALRAGSSAMHAANTALEHGAAPWSPARDDVVLTNWLDYDRHTRDLAVYAIQFLLWWMKSED